MTVSLRYADLLSTLPSRIRVLAWPVHPSKKMISTSDNSNEASSEAAATVAQSIPSRLSYAEDALRTMSLPEGLFFYSTFFSSCARLNSLAFVFCASDFFFFFFFFWLQIFFKNFAAYAEIVLHLPRMLQQMHQHVVTAS